MFGKRSNFAPAFETKADEEIAKAGLPFLWMLAGILVVVAILLVTCQPSQTSLRVIAAGVTPAVFF